MKSPALWVMNIIPRDSIYHLSGYLAQRKLLDREVLLNTEAEPASDRADIVELFNNITRSLLKRDCTFPILLPTYQLVARDLLRKSIIHHGTKNRTLGHIGHR
jgi:hypothetical protein